MLHVAEAGVCLLGAAGPGDAAPVPLIMFNLVFGLKKLIEILQSLRYYILIKIRKYSFRETITPYRENLL